jgi:hypothetical protein
MTNPLLQDELSRSFGLYNAIVIATDGTRIRWNNTLGFSFAVEGEPWPVVDISGRPTILAAVEEWINARKPQNK